MYSRKNKKYNNNWPSRNVGVWHIFPGIGSYNDAENFAEKFASMILPWCVLAVATAAIYARYLRSQMIDVMEEDYIRTARAKGLTERRIIYRHALRSSLAPVVSQFGIDLGALMGGAIVTEVVFGLPGLGREAVLAITNQDLPVIMGITILSAVLVVAANLLVDLVHALIDPRIRLE